MKVRSIRLMNLSKRVAKLKQLPPKVGCDEISQGAIDELIDIQLNARKRKQVVEFYYNLVQQEHVADPRTDEELKEYYRALALDKHLDPVVRVNSLKYFLALKHHLFQQRTDIKPHCKNYKHSYVYVGGTDTVLSFKCKYCGETISSTSCEYLNPANRSEAIRRFTGERQPSCKHDWSYTGGREDSIYFTCKKCGDKFIIESPKLAKKSYRVKEISNYDDRALLSASDNKVDLCNHMWILVEENSDRKVLVCSVCGAKKSYFKKKECEHDWRYNHREMDLLVCKKCGAEQVISERDLNDINK